MDLNVNLTRREWDVLDLLLQGKSNKMIAARLDISERTVEFHLNNIFSKLNVGSRLELVLKITNAADLVKNRGLGQSTVVKPTTIPDNGIIRGMHGPTQARTAIPLPVKELNVKALLRSKHVRLGATASFCSGILWVLLIMTVGHSPLSTLGPWLAPLLLSLIGIGVFTGWRSMRRGASLWNAALASLFASGMAAFAVIPITGFVIYPLAKLAEAAGMINRATIADNTATAMVYAAMILTWLGTGILLGLLFTRMARRALPPPMPVQ